MARVLAGALFLALMVAAPGVLPAGKADVVDVQITKTAADTFRLDVTVRHADSGWAHYADKWDVVQPDGKVLGERVLLHPHEDEQPFTRSLAGVRIPASVPTVTVRAYDKVHGAGGVTKSVTVPH